MPQTTSHLYHVEEAAESDRKCRECNEQIQAGVLCWGKLFHGYFEEVQKNGRCVKGTWRCFDCVPTEDFYACWKNGGEVFDLTKLSGFETLDPKFKKQVERTFAEVEGESETIAQERKELKRAEKEAERKALAERRALAASKRSQVKKSAVPAQNKPDLRAMFDLGATAKAKEKAAAKKAKEEARAADREAAQAERAAAKAAAKEEADAAKALERKRKKDPNAPKRPQSSYFLWANDDSTNAKVKAANPNAKVTELASAKGVLWKAMADEEKKPFEAAAAKAKAEYEEAQAVYLASDGYAEWKNAPHYDYDDDVATHPASA